MKRLLKWSILGILGLTIVASLAGIIYLQSAINDAFEPAEAIAGQPSISTYASEPPPTNIDYAPLRPHTLDLQTLPVVDRSTRPWARWWWPGGDVDAKQTCEELRLMDARGIGGVEIQSFKIGLETIEDEAAQAKINSFASAAKAVSKGFEADITIVPVDGLTLSGALSYNDAKYKSFEQAPCYSLQTEAQGCVQVRVDPDDPGNLATTPAQDLSGAPLANAPEWILNGFARYDFSISDTVGAFVQGGLQYRDDALSLVSNDPQSRIDAYTLIDAQIGVTFWDNKATMSLFGRNLTNQNFVAAIVPMPFDEGGYAQFRTFEAQRTWGARLALKF